MQPSKEKITQTILEVMSQRQFHFAKRDFNFPTFEFGAYSDIFLLIIVCGFLFFAFYKLRSIFSFQAKPEQTVPIKVGEIEPELPRLPIKKLHALFLKSLQTKKKIVVRSWKTNTDYINESETLLFQQVCRLYDATVYGSKAVPPEAIAELSDRFALWEEEA